MTRKIIGFTGRMHTGKDTAGNYLCAAHGFQRFAFADTLKSGIQKFGGFSDDQLWGESKDSVDVFWGITPRQMLQDVGTFMREKYTPDFWAMNLRRFAEENPGTDIVITDVRYDNEIEIIKDLGGFVVRVWRPSTMKEIIQQDSVSIHASERQEFSVDETIDNSTTKGHLYHQIDELMYRWYDVPVPAMLDNGWHFMQGVIE